MQTHHQPKGVQLAGVTKIYQDPKSRKALRAVDDVTLDIAPGSFVTLLGPSGCGKTTTLRMIAGFESPDTGEILLGGQPINALPPNRRDTAMVFQSYALFPHYNVFDNVAYGLKLRNVPKEELRRRVLDMLDLVELEGLENRMTNQLSGGQQQRVALARALVVEPGVLLFDEPLSNLDAKLRIAMRTQIRRIQQTLGITAIYVTHDQAEAMSLSDQIILMQAGRIAQRGSPTDIYYHPVSEFVADFIGEANFLRGKVVRTQGEDCALDIAGVQVWGRTDAALSPGQDATLILRPEAAQLLPSGEKAEGLLPCTITLSCFMGAYQLYHAQVAGQEIKITDPCPLNKRIFEVGEAAKIVFARTCGHVV